MSKIEDKQVRCSFCGKREGQVKRLIAGPGVFICDECIDLCCDILHDDFLEDDLEEIEGEDILAEGDSKLLKPAEIKAALDEYVIGQDRAKRALAVAVYNHYKRLDDNKKIKENQKGKRKKVKENQNDNEKSESDIFPACSSA